MKKITISLTFLLICLNVSAQDFTKEPPISGIYESGIITVVFRADGETVHADAPWIQIWVYESTKRQIYFCIDHDGDGYFGEGEKRFCPSEVHVEDLFFLDRPGSAEYYLWYVMEQQTYYLGVKDKFNNYAMTEMLRIAEWNE